MKKLMAVGALALAMVAVSRDATAQSAQIGARATVQQALTVAAGDSLIFGAVFPNTTRSILPSSTSSGSFDITGAANAEVTLTFGAAPTLSDGTNTLQVTFGSSSAAYNALADNRGAATSFDPTAVATTRLDATNGTLWVYIGGSVSPTTQPAGSYTGAITLSVAYTGF
jgi:hypothetical protein